jgi:ADP-heptose:LPS heptosyltransferase
MGWGDELMVTGHARELQARDPRRVRPVYERPRDHEAWANNPRIAGKNEQGDFQAYVARTDGLRPYMKAKSPDRYLWKAYAPPRGELYFTDKELAFAAERRGRIVLEPCTKPGASPNKDWGWERWVELAALMKQRGLAPTQLGAATTRRLPGAEFIETNCMRYAAAVLSVARAAVLPEGGLHHVAAAVRCPAVVIYGGFISPAVTGYAGQRALFVQTPAQPLGCGWRRSCKHCAEAMAQFTPAGVLAELEGLLVPASRHLAA